MLFGSLLVAKSISATLIFDGACIPVLSSAAKAIVMPSHALGLEINPFYCYVVLTTCMVYRSQSRANVHESSGQGPFLGPRLLSFANLLH